MTPTFGRTGEITGHHSNRRTPDRSALAQIEPLYRALLEEEKRHAAKADQIAHSTKILVDVLGQKGMPYDELVFALMSPERSS